MLDCVVTLWSQKGVSISSAKFSHSFIYLFIQQKITECLNVPRTALSTNKNECDQGSILQMPRASGRRKHLVYGTKYCGILERRRGNRAVVGRVRTQIVYKEL